MPVVADSGPLIVFARAGRLDLLHATVGDVFIPEEVAQEVYGQDPTRPGAADVAQAMWIHRVPVSSTDFGVVGRGAGEEAAIALATERGVLLIIDDWAGRHRARRQGLPILGSCGVVRLAKGLGLVPAVKPVVDALLTAGLWLGPGLYRSILAQADEGPP